MKKLVSGLSALGLLCASIAIGAQNPTAQPRSGKQVYDTACMACHASGAAGAPKFGDAAAWKPRAAQGEAKLLEHVTKGFKAMPARGTCTKCSDAELKAAIEYMLSKAQSQS